MSKEAMKRALEALETERNNYKDWDEKDGAPEYIYEAITALREALANEALDRMAENARELGLHYDPAQHGPVHSTQISKVWWGVKENT